MKGLVQFINEGIDKMLHDLKELIPETDWDKCDRMGVDDALQLIVDTLEDYGEKIQNPKASLARMKEKSKGKDTTTGHWEIAGITSEKQTCP